MSGNPSARSNRTGRSSCAYVQEAASLLTDQLNRSLVTSRDALERDVPGVVEISEGENLVVERPRLLVQSFRALWSDDAVGANAPGLALRHDSSIEAAQMPPLHGLAQPLRLKARR